MPPPPPLAGRRLPKGEADAFGTAAGSCGCDLSAGAVVLFYAYVPVSDPAALAARIEASCAAHGVTGKLRVALEGINGTAAGPTAGIDALEALLASADETREPALARAASALDFKRRPGCAHYFDALSVRVVDEIVPFRAAIARPSSASTPPPIKIARLSPEAFHDAILDPSAVVLDVRNWYESRVGRFERAVLAPIRRFSQLPEWASAGENAARFRGRRVLMYCTGGVRCEKAAAWFATDPSVAPREIGVLEGGVVAYAEAFGRDSCVSENSCVSRSGGDDGCAAADDASRGILDGRVGASSASVSESVSIESVSESVDPANEQKARRSRFLGSNFVFDTRGVVRVTADVTGWCDGCGDACDRVGRCAGRACHVILLICERCDLAPAGVFCCARCEAQEGGGGAKRLPCECDGYASRERRLTARAERRTDEATRRRPPSS